MSEGIITSNGVPEKQPTSLESGVKDKMPPGKGRYTIGGKGTHGCKGYPVVGGEGKVHGCHPTKGAAIRQQSAIYASQNQQKMADALLELAKMHDSLDKLEKSMDGSGDESHNCPCAGQSDCQCDDSMHQEDEDWAKRDYSPEQRRAMARRGQAMPDGSFPIGNRADLGNAIQSVGRAANYDAARRHIIGRARALGAIDMLPEDWNVSKSIDGLFKNMPSSAKRVHTTGNARISMKMFKDEQ